MTPDQMKAARALLGWSRTRLAAWSDTTSRVVTMFEQTGQVGAIFRNGLPEPIDALAAIHATLEAAGIEFTEGDTPGVRMRHLQDRA